MVLLKQLKIMIAIATICIPTLLWGGMIQKKVLLINSYHPTMQWEENIKDGIKEVFKTNTHFDIQLSVEYMDTKNYFSDEYMQNLVNIYEYKYSQENYDVIIACDNNAFDLVKAYYDEIFNSAPVVFCGINYFESSMIEGFTNITGVIESISIKNTIELILSLHPETETIYVLNDQSTTGKANYQAYQAVKKQYDDQVNFVYNDDLTMQEAVLAHAQLIHGEILFVLSFVRDAEGEFYSYEESTLNLSQACPVPIYGLWDFMIGNGIVGGYVLSGNTQGQLAGSMAMQILNGIPVSKIPVIESSPNQYIFDYSQLIQHNIQRSELPENSIIVNKPETFFYRYRWILLIFVTIILILIALLVRIKIRHSHAQKNYINSEDRYRKLVKVAFEAIMIHDDHVILDVNPKFEELSGFSAKEAIGMNVYDLVIPNFHDIVKQRIVNNENKPSQVKIYKKDGTPMWIEINAKNIIYNGNHARVVIFRDVTELKESQEAIKSWLNFEQTVSHILSQFVDIKDLDRVITVSLGDLAIFAGCNHAYFFRISKDNKKLELKNEWVGDGAVPQLGILDDYNAGDFKWAINKLINGESLIIPDIERLPTYAAFLSDLLRASGVFSILAVPIVKNNQFAGLVGLDSNQQTIYWSDEQVGLLRLFSEVLSKVMEKQGF